MTLDAFLDRLTGVQASGTGYAAWCPAHPDARPGGRRSLSISNGRAGRILLKCHRGCTNAAILSALDQPWSAMFADDDRPAHARFQGRPVLATYDYTDAGGRLRFQVLRRAGGRFTQRRPRQPTDDPAAFTKHQIVVDATWVWSLQTFEPVAPGDPPCETCGAPHRTVRGVAPVLYHLPRLLAADPTALRFIVEGEKDVHTCEAHGLVATTNPSGAGKWHPEFAQHFAGRRVVILPDNDDAGREHATEVRQSLDGVAASVQVLALPGLPEKGDVSDWLAQGHTVADLLALVEQQPTEPTAEPRFRLLTVEELIARPLPPSLIDGVLPQGVIGVLAGEGGTGKSFTALDWSLSIATGRAWQGHAVQQGSVVYLLAETDPFFAQRIAAWQAYHQVPTSALAGFRILPDVVSPFRDLDVRDFTASVGTLDPPPVLIVVDTVAVSIAGHDENASETMSSLVDFAHALRRAFGCSVLLLHHPSLQGHLVRGHSSLECNVDLIVRLKAQEDLVTLSCLKDRHALPFAPIYMRLQKVAADDGAPLSAVLVPSTRHAAAAQINLTCREVLATLVTLSRSTSNVTFTDWLDQSGKPRTTFTRSRDALLDAELIAHDGAHYEPTPRGVLLVSATEVAEDSHRSHRSHGSPTGTNGT